VRLSRGGGGLFVSRYRQSQTRSGRRGSMLQAVTDAHGVDAHGVDAIVTAQSHTDTEDRSQRLSQSITVPDDCP